MKLVINRFEDLSQEEQENLQDFVSGITQNWVIKNE